MLLTKIEVENYGVFRDKHTFDLKTQHSSSMQKPIILFGGKNGSGKTTLFEAIRLCLYGNSFQGRKMAKSTYQRYIQDHLHRPLEASPITKASTSVEFNYTHSGHVDTYLVKRSWSCNDTQIVELLEVYQNGICLKDIDEDQWQDFLIELIPLGVSKLFFFDGEQIQNIAETEADNNYLTGSINTLLGLDLVEKLQTDLRIYALRKAKEEDKNVKIELAQCENRQRTLEEELDRLLQDKAHLQSRIDRNQSEIEQQEHQIAKEGGGFANKREELKILQTKIEEEISLTKEKIRTLCSGLLPFSLIPALCISLRDRLIKEDEYEQSRTAIKSLNPLLENLEKKVQSKDFWEDFRLSSEEIDRIANKIVKTLKEDVEPAHNEPTPMVHDISTRERNGLMDMIDKALADVPSDLRQLTTNLEKLSRQQQEVERSLFRAPADDVLHPMIQKLSSLHEELNSLRQEYRDMDEKLTKVNNELKQTTQLIQKKVQQEIELNKLSQLMALAEKTQKILYEYADRLRREKIESFSEVFLECFKSLSNKEHLIEKIEINSDSFSMILEGRNGQTTQKNQLSAGEKQIYAVAMLWALARVSGREIPFMIDTPLGRLDVEHRDNIVENFFPCAGHQVIIFSTDAEIDRQYFEKLQPYISKAYHLEYNEKFGKTNASIGYFWESKREGDLHEFQ